MDKWEKLRNNFSKLVDVKSLMTIALTAVVCVLAIQGRFDVKDIYLMIVAFFFGTQSTKKSNDKEDK